MYLNKDKLQKKLFIQQLLKQQSKVKPKTSVDNPAQNTKTTSKSGKSVKKKPTTPQVVVEKSRYSFQSALNAQMARGYPQRVMVIVGISQVVLQLAVL